MCGLRLAALVGAEQSDFDPAVSGLEKSLAFPLLVSNATSYLLAQAETASTKAAEAFDPAESDIAPRATLPLPLSLPLPLPLPLGVPSGELSTGESALGASRGGGEGRVRADALAGLDFAERWQWLMAAALVVLGAEWLVFARRG